MLNFSWAKIVCVGNSWLQSAFSLALFGSIQKCKIFWQHVKSNSDVELKLYKVKWNVEIITAVHFIICINSFKFCSSFLRFNKYFINPSSLCSHNWTLQKQLIYGRIGRINACQPIIAGVLLEFEWWSNGSWRCENWENGKEWTLPLFVLIRPIGGSLPTCTHVYFSSSGQLFRPQSSMP